MNEITKIIIAGAVGLIVGAGGVMLFCPSKAADSVHVMSDGTTMSGSMDMQGEMDAMMQALDGKTGDAFDKAFLEEMILHHQGAVSMAESALKNSKHQEIKDLAEDIISAQNSEIQQMQSWQQTWYAR